MYDFMSSNTVQRSNVHTLFSSIGRLDPIGQHYFFTVLTPSSCSVFPGLLRLQHHHRRILLGGALVGDVQRERGQQRVAGAFVPRSKREQKLLRPVGKRIATGAAAAVAAAKATGKEQFSSALMSRDTAKEGARKVLDSALKAAKGGKSTRDA